MFVPTRQTSFFRKSKLYLKRKIDTGYVVFIEYSTYTTKKMCSVLHGYWNVATSDLSKSNADSMFKELWATALNSECMYLYGQSFISNDSHHPEAIWKCLWSLKNNSFEKRYN